MGAIVAAAAAVAAVMVVTSRGNDAGRVASQYVQAWSHDDYARMYALLDSRSRAALDQARFAAAYRRAAAAATLVALTPGRVGSPHDGAVPVPVTARTRLFGDLRETVQVPVSGSGSQTGVRFDGSLVFPGLLPGERLTRRLVMPPRAALLADDGTPLAQGPDRSSPIPGVASGIVGTLGPIPAAQAAVYAAQGYPPAAQVGLDGLERDFQAQLAGLPGGELLAGGRVLAARAPTPGQNVTTTIDPAVERAVIGAIGGQYAGIVALDPRTGGVLGAAGVAWSARQPPGSTMKIVTSTAALQAGLVRLTDTFPIQTGATIEGFHLQNANGEACGGTLINAFAVSCNSVFAPLGAKLGATRLVVTAQRFGFDQPPPFPGAAESVIPSAATIGDSLAVGASAIGQGKVQATALQMADVAATIADHGQRPIPTLAGGAVPRFVSVTTPEVAAQVQRMMLAVVQYGTGTAAQIPGVAVAGKTGTAELTDTANPGASSAANTDAWFVAFAPAEAPRIVVGALFPNQGAGGATAAPAVRSVLVSGLARH